MADARDVHIEKLQEQLRLAEARERRFGEIIAQQQTLIAAQQQIADLQRRLSEQDVEQKARVRCFALLRLRLRSRYATARSRSPKNAYKTSSVRRGQRLKPNRRNALHFPEA